MKVIIVMIILNIVSKIIAKNKKANKSGQSFVPEVKPLQSNSPEMTQSCTSWTNKKQSIGEIKMETEELNSYFRLAEDLNKKNAEIFPDEKQNLCNREYKEQFDFKSDKYRNRPKKEKQSKIQSVLKKEPQKLSKGLKQKNTRKQENEEKTSAFRLLQQEENVAVKIEETPVLDKHRTRPEEYREFFSDKDLLKQAFIIKEILDDPVSLRRKAR